MELSEAFSPEEKSQGLEKGLEVVVVINGSILVQLNVPKHLTQQDRGLIGENPSRK